MNHQQDPVIHPSSILIALLIGGLSMLFMGLSGAYIYNRLHFVTEGVPVPVLFYFNTLVIIGASYALHQARKAFDADHGASMWKWLVMALGATLAFLVLQLLAWGLMFDEGLSFHGIQSEGYLFLIPMLHFLHIVGGLPFLMKYMLTARKHLAEPASALVFFSDPARRRRLSLVTIYWHFVDVLWIYLVLFFTVSALL